MFNPIAQMVQFRILPRFWRSNPGGHQWCGGRAGTWLAGRSPKSNQVVITGLPVAPATIVAVYDPSTSGGRVTLTWQNSSKNETGFKIYRLDGTGSFALLASNPADATTFTESAPTDPWPWTYKVVSTNNAGSSSGVTINVQPIGGPDITGHLLAIRQAVLAKIATLLPAAIGVLYKDFVPITNITGVGSNWDIAALFQQSVSTSRNSGILPDGEHTVTVAGGVYADDAVNYWLYGAILKGLGIAQSQGEACVESWVVLAHRGKKLKEKLAWFDSGYTGNFGPAAATAIKGVSPDVAPTPRQFKTSTLGWHMDNYFGSN